MLHHKDVGFVAGKEVCMISGMLLCCVWGGVSVYAYVNVSMWVLHIFTHVRVWDSVVCMSV